MKARVSLGVHQPGHDAYVTRGELRILTHDAPRWWSLHRAPTSVMAAQGGTAKCWDKFPDHQDADKMEELLREYADLGVARPSSYACIFHDHYRPPRPSWSPNAALAPAFSGGWQWAAPGQYRGVYRRYDIRSAYLWAGSLGLPDPTTYRRSSEITAGIPGVYRVVLAEPVAGAPFPYDRDSVTAECLVTAEDVTAYDLPIKEVLAGVTWTRDLDPEPMLRAVRLTSTAKQVARCYWGRWGMTEPLMCHTRTRSWRMANVDANLVWAHLIVARVRRRVWESARDAVHIYVDSVITPHELTTGVGYGEWRLEQTYPDGVLIRGPGRYTSYGSVRFEKFAGAPANSPLRDMLADRNQNILREFQGAA